LLTTSWITRTQLENADRIFQPVVVRLPVAAVVGAAPTTVWITTPNTLEVDLVATFSPATPISSGVRRVAGTQTITSTVDLDFGKALPLNWMASVLKKGDLAPNQAYFIYVSDMDDFVMPLNADITLKHQNGAWQIPAYDTLQYTVNVGFGLGATYIGWGYSLACQPNQTLIVKAGSYELVRSNGQEQIGDPVVANQGDWAMPMGFTYTLAFDGSGNGVLTRQ
jgi:hypothetical protein